MDNPDNLEYGYRQVSIRTFPDIHATDLVLIPERELLTEADIHDTTFAEEWLGIPPTGE
jgi:hypothetical protein